MYQRSMGVALGRGIQSNPLGCTADTLSPACIGGRAGGQTVRLRSNHYQHNNKPAVQRHPVLYHTNATPFRTGTGCSELFWGSAQTRIQV